MNNYFSVAVYFFLNALVASLFIIAGISCAPIHQICTLSDELNYGAVGLGIGIILNTICSIIMFRICIPTFTSVYY